jgi:hypothetical protein
MSKNIQEKAKGKITISRWSGGARGGGISIELTDETSGTRFLNVEMSIEDFGGAITGMSYMDCEFGLRAQNVGKIRESKSMVIPFKNTDYKKREEDEITSLAPFEVDGWRGSHGDLGNHHRSAWVDADGWHCYRVNFTRFVDAPKESESNPLA